MPGSPQGGGQAPAPAQAPPKPKPKRPRTPADENRAINIALYVGGLVLTAAALAFVAATQDPVLTAVSLLVAYLTFAGTGLWLSSRVAILKPAGIAIFGTSLALLAVAARPVNDAFIHNGHLTWTLVSITGLIVYGYASIHLDSRVLGYLVIPFLYSSIFGSTVVLQVPLVWTLATIMVVSALVQLGIIITGDRIPAVLRRPFGQLHWMVVPGVLIAALIQIEQVSSLDYMLLFSTAAAYYAVNAVRPVTEKYRPVLALASRAAATVALLSLLMHQQVEGPGPLAILTAWFSALYILVARFPVLAGLPRGQKTPIAALTRGRIRRWDLSLGLGLTILAGLTVQAGILLPEEPVSASYYAWLGLTSAALLGTLGYTLFGLHPQVTAQHKRVLAGVLRCTFAVATLIPVAHHPWFALAWLAIWAAAEIRLTGPVPRATMHRAQAVAAMAIIGWLVGQLADDPTMGARLALLGFAVGTAGVVVLLMLRGEQSRVRSAESVVYWCLAVLGFTSGAAAFGLTAGAVPIYAVVAMAVIYSTAVLVLTRAEPLQGLKLQQSRIFIRTLAFAAGAAIGVLSIDWGSAWALDSSVQAAPVTYALVILLGFGAAELLAAAVLSRISRGAADGPQQAATLRAPELWPGTHLAAHGIWAGLINLAVFAARPVFDGGADQLWWLTIPAWAIACWAGLRAISRTDRQSIPVTVRLLPSRIYGALVLTGAFSAMISASASGSASVSGSAVVWWAELLVAASAALLAMLALKRVGELKESAVVALIAVAAGAYLLVAAVAGLWRGSEAGRPAELLLAATLAIVTVTVVARSLMGRYAPPDPEAPGSQKDQGLVGQGLVIAGTAAAVLMILGMWHLGAMPRLPSSAFEPMLMVASAAVTIGCLYMLLHWTVSNFGAAMGAAPLRDGSPVPGAQTEEVGQGPSPQASPLSWHSAVRVAAFIAAVLLALIAIDISLATDRGFGAGLGWLNRAHAVGALVLAALIFAAEIIGTRRLSQSPAHRWVPAHLAANALWLASINLLMVILDLSADLFWFTAMPWAAASVIFMWGAAKSTGADTGSLGARSNPTLSNPTRSGPTPPGAAPADTSLASTALPMRDLIAARAYALGVLILLLGAVAAGPHWWVQAVTAAAALLVAIGTLLWGSRVPEAPYAVPLYVVAGAAVLLVRTVDEVLGGVVLWSSPSEHLAALGYLVSAGVFLSLGVLALAARRLWEPGPVRRQLMLVTGAAAVLASLVPVLTAQQFAAAGLAWVVPGMHLVLILVALRIRRLRPGGALVGSILLPLSGLFAYGMGVAVGAVALAVTLFLVVAGTLAAEAALYLRSEGQDRSTWQLMHWLAAGAATTLIALTSLGTEAVAPQFIALASAAVLLVAGLLRGARLGLYWGAAVIVISILWALRGIMFLFLIVLGALIIGAAIWRLVTVQKKQKNTPDAAADESVPNAQPPGGPAATPSHGQQNPAPTPPPGEYRPPGYTAPPSDYRPPTPPGSG